MKQRLILKNSTKLILLYSGWVYVSIKLKIGTKTETYKLTVLHTNDNHGRFWQNKYGMSARKTLVDQLRAEIEAENGSVLLLSGGDINTGVPKSDLQRYEPLISKLWNTEWFTNAMAYGQPRVWQLFKTYCQKADPDWSWYSQCYLQTYTTKQQANASSKLTRRCLKARWLSRLRLSV